MADHLKKEWGEKILVLVAGGTGGHVYPAIALAEQAVQEGFSVVMVTDKRGQVFFQEDLALFSSFLVVENTLGSFRRLWQLFGQWSGKKGVCAMGFGGQMTVMPLVLARLRGLRTAIHQSDVKLGKANKWLSYGVHACFSGCPVQDRPSFRVIGTPVREKFRKKLDQSLKMSKDGVREETSEVSEPFHLLVMGGSQGASFWSTLFPDAIALLDHDDQRRLRIHHQVRLEDLNQTEQAYQKTQARVVLNAFFLNIEELMIQADVVFSRAGASTLAELSLLGKPTFFVPYPYAEGHQIDNARFVVDQGGGWMALQSEVSSLTLSKFIHFCLHNKEKVLYTGERMKSVLPSHAVKSLLCFASDGS